MGIETDQEIVQLVGSEELFFNGLAGSLEECALNRIYTQAQALEWIGSKIKTFKRQSIIKRAKVTVMAIAF
jgi:DNA-directed RNA polymerase III subunit RPC2